MDRLEPGAIDAAQETRVQPEAGEKSGDGAGKRRAPVRQGKITLFIEFTSFLRQEGKWWLTPIIVILLLLGVVLFIAEGSVLLPFVYTLF